MITKEQWKEVEDALRGDYSYATFKLGDDEIKVSRIRYKEGEKRLGVYLNGEIKWGYTIHKGEDEKYRALVEKFWRKQTRAVFKPKEKKKIEKAWGGKKKARESFPKLDDQVIYRDPIFAKAKTLVNQFKKVKELELIEFKFCHL